MVSHVMAGRVAVVEGADVKLAALRALLRSTTTGETGPLDLDGKEARFTRLVRDGRDANEIAIELDLPIDEVIAGLWRLAS